MAPKRKRRRYGDRTHQEKRRGLTLVIGSLTAIAVAGGTAIWSHGPDLDKSTGCPLTHRAPPAHTILLLDQTDALPRSEIEYAKALVRNEYYWLPVGGQLTLRNISGDASDDEDTVVLCRVIDPSEANPLTQNEGMLKRDYARTAGARLDKFLNSLSESSEKPKSPILESIVALFRRTDFSSDIKSRRVVVLSDMAQNSDLRSDYGPSRSNGNPDIDPGIAAEAQGAEIRVHYVRRPQLWFQGPEHRHSWEVTLGKLTDDVVVGHTLHMGEDPQREVWHEAKR